MKISAKDFQESGSKYLQEIQSSFGGGMNLQVDIAVIEKDEYGAAFNVSNRYSDLAPLKLHQEIASSIPGKKHGIYAIGAYFVLFAGGLAYYRIENGDFILIENFHMSTTAERYYVAFVPASTVNTLRSLAQPNNNTAVVVNPSITISGTPQALVVQDGVSQPWILYIDGSSVKSRVTQTYEQWDSVSNNREYVPIGTDMLFTDGILFVVSADRQSFYRSVTGRPLDFVVNVATNGYKGGDANTTKYSPSYNRIVAIVPLSEQSFLVSTDAPYTYQITLNRDRTIFGEPTFNRSDLFNAALTNSFSIVDLLGDVGFITYKGIRSFNATLQLKIESKNAIFSAKINRAFEYANNVDIIQDDSCCAVEFRDYALFSVNSTYGNVLAVFDKINQKWASFVHDVGDVKIKQFASLMPTVNELYAIGTNDKVYQLFGSSEYAPAVVMTRDFCIDNPQFEQKIDSARLVIKNQPDNGTMLVSVYADDLLAQVMTKQLVADVDISTYSEEFPINRGLAGLNSLLFEFRKNPKNGWRIGYILQWTGGGELNTFLHNGEINTPALNQAQQTRV